MLCINLGALPWWGVIRELERLAPDSLSPDEVFFVLGANVVQMHLFSESYEVRALKISPKAKSGCAPLGESTK